MHETPPPPSPSPMPGSLMPAPFSSAARACQREQAPRHKRMVATLMPDRMVDPLPSTVPPCYHTL